MSLREKLERNKTWLVPLVLIVALVAVGFSLWGTQRAGDLPDAVTQGYFTTDDGKTFFAASLTKSAPFDQGGKPAYRAYVYRCGSGAPFVASIGKYATPGGLIELRRVGDTKWVSFGSPEGQALFRAKCPDGSAAEPVEVQ